MRKLFFNNSNNPSNVVFYTMIKTKMGWVGLTSNEKGLTRLILPENSSEKVWEQLHHYFHSGEVWVKEDRLFTSLQKRIQAYFEGKPSEFYTEKVDLSAYTPFQRKVLLITRTIPYGEIKSYRWLAEQSGSHYAYRAVGRVMSINPLPLIIPCHRVIGSRGELTGFSAPGGIELKRKMLALEGTIVRDIVRDKKMNL